MDSRAAGPERPGAQRVHRDALAQMKAAVTVWASNAQNRAVAMSILELLAPCADDKDGDSTLDCVDSVFEEYRGLPESLLQRLGALAEAAHGLAQEAE